MLTFFRPMLWVGIVAWAVVFMSAAVNKTNSFRTEQKKFPRVRKAYSNAEKGVKKLFDSLNRNYATFHMIITANKSKEKLYVYTSDKANGEFTHLKTYDFCVLSGTLGPKRREGDLQVPEGFYHISRFNPSSNFHLSLKVNYPNASDKVLSSKKSPGGEIYIHGHCVSVGCIPITDACIEELYLMCVEATAHGQKEIPVYIFPFSMDDESMENLKETYSVDTSTVTFWKNLQKGYAKWKLNHKKLKFRVDARGRYTFQ